jgi:3-methyl-2-oxobutanoate hydroxymethyltransferase
LSAVSEPIEPRTPSAPAAASASAENEQPAPYGTGPSHLATTGATGRRRTRVHHLQQLKERGERWAMLTAYDQYSAEIFDEAGIPVLLVGDSAGNNVFGYETTLPVTVDELLPLVRAVSRSAPHALVIADLPFGSYQSSPEQALASAMRMMKEGLAHGVKLEGGRRVVPQVEALVGAGIPVMAHLGFTPQSEHTLGGYRVQGRGEAADRLGEDACALLAAGAFSVVLEMVPAPVAARVTEVLAIPTIGIGAGPDCDAQVLVWQDMAGLRGGKAPRFVKRYADLRGALLEAARAYAGDVQERRFPGGVHTFSE